MSKTTPPNFQPPTPHYHLDHRPSFHFPHFLLPHPMATQTDDFSFPTFTDASPISSSGLDSPPLWRLSPVASPDCCHRRTQTNVDEQYNCRADCNLPITGAISSSKFAAAKRKSFSHPENNGDHTHHGSEDDDDEEEEEEEEREKMDMLWEDFNEEKLCSRSSGHRARGSASRTSTESAAEKRGVNVGCVEGLRLSKASAGDIYAPSPKINKPSLVVFMKVLKKFFLLHNNSHRSVQNHNSRKKRSW